MLARRCAVFAFVLAFALFSCGASSQDPQPDQTIAVLVTTSAGAPSADDLVTYYRGPQLTPPPLQGLTVGNPQKIAYLIPVRAAGDFLARLEAHPDSVSAALERYVVVIYPPGTDLSAPLAALQADPYVQAAYLPPAGEFSTPPADSSAASAWTPPTPSAPSTDDPQYGRSDLNIDAAWLWAGGYALIADIDSGLYPQHPALRQFDAAGHYIGGAFVLVDSLDISLAGRIDPPQNSNDVDERRAMPVSDPACNPDPVNHPYMQPMIAGHGTHVSGLMAANRNAGPDVQGTCERCSIAMWKTAYAICVVTDGVGTVKLGSNYTAWAAALKLIGDLGASVANMSFGRSTAGEGPQPTFCEHNPLEPMCLAIAHATYRDVAMVASSGNGRTQLDFPAADPNVIAAGGFQRNLAIWDLWPACPPEYGLSQCGSNFTTNITYGARQELVGSAQSVLSTTYPGYNWNPALQCGDQFPGPAFGNGVGWCTGTSMSAPQIAGVIGILRSINPLVHVGAGATAPGTIREVLASTTVEAQSGLGWGQFRGYGRPDAAAAARRMLGTVAGATVRNRATPLFRLYSTGAHDYADVSSPQLAIGMMINSTQAWRPPATLPLVPNYPSLPHDPADGTVEAPHASIYVMTTEFKPRPEWPSLVPLHLMDRDFADGQVDDFLLATTVADIEYAHAHGYNLRSIQGYVYAPCSPEPGCIPPGAERLYRACHAIETDCATFLESESSTFAAAGYTTTYPPAGGTKSLLGYAYPATDTDADGLPDGFEYVVGTSPTRADSDADGAYDAIEFPMIGVSTRDPCLGGVGARYCGADVIFTNGYDFP